MKCKTNQILTFLQQGFDKNNWSILDRGHLSHENIFFLTLGNVQFLPLGYTPGIHREAVEWWIVLFKYNEVVSCTSNDWNFFLPSFLPSAFTQNLDKQINSFHIQIIFLSADF